ncbi:MAG: N-acetylmuramoyl-L-alanine amidase [Clostridiales bacterium]|nr:N-acetylmuramoyl-L-alanine amidase [Clostridiales bacterium]
MTPRRVKRKKYLVRRLVGILFVIGIIVSAVILSVRMTAEGDAPLHIPETVAAGKISLDAVQGKLEDLDWVRQDRLPVNDYSRPGTALKKINNIVIHYVGNPGTTAAQNRSYYSRLADNHETSASSNFLIGMKGEILTCVPVNEVAYCSNWRNDDTISIECCHPDETGKFTGDTYDSLVRLTAWLCNALGLDSGDIIRHYDVTGKECPKYYVDHEEAWVSFKDDVQDALDDLRAA